GYQKYDQLPSVIINGIVFLPVTLAVLVMGLAIHFNRSPVFFYVILVVIANIVLGLGMASTYLAYALVSILLPLLLLVLTLLPERGIFSANAIPAHATLLSSLFFTFVIAMMSPEWTEHLLLSDWLPARYFDWTPQSQSVWLVSVVVFIYMLVLCFVRTSPHMFAGLGVLVMLIAQLHFGETSRSLNMFSSAALLMCLYAVLQESWRMAYLDELTELPGRRALREKFQKMSGVYTVAMLDVDHFKKFNDTYGHDTGDGVLRMIAGRLRKVTGGGVSYRYGGEEFSVVFNGKSKEDAAPYLETLRESIASSLFVVNRVSRRQNDRKPSDKNHKAVTVTVSIGIADSTGDVESPWDVLKLADKALYRAKGKGRNCVSG
ncbi:MAG: GGDEF domain-containing protein, partial [Gammaproteobacteria bacterium]|nr:GGDEF domain-containing protein [Gammaproteobacteria bacterium]MCW9004523.1 GGDEF domain-containing protein [Gammaproteobacteria bacterium]